MVSPSLIFFIMVSPISLLSVMVWLVWSFNSKNDWKSELKKVVFCGESRFRILISNILSITFSLVAVNLS